jgi:hypothetical protein
LLLTSCTPKLCTPHTWWWTVNHPRYNAAGWRVKLISVDFAPGKNLCFLCNLSCDGLADRFQLLFIEIIFDRPDRPTAGPIKLIAITAKWKTYTHVTHYHSLSLSLSITHSLFLTLSPSFSHTRTQKVILTHVRTRNYPLRVFEWAAAGNRDVGRIADDQPELPRCSSWTVLHSNGINTPNPYISSPTLWRKWRR